MSLATLARGHLDPERITIGYHALQRWAERSWGRVDGCTLGPAEAEMADAELRVLVGKAKGKLPPVRARDGVPSRRWGVGRWWLVCTADGTTLLTVYERPITRQQVNKQRRRRRRLRR